MLPKQSTFSFFFSWLCLQGPQLSTGERQDNPTGLVKALLLPPLLASTRDNVIKGLQEAKYDKTPAKQANYDLRNIVRIKSHFVLV